MKQLTTLKLLIFTALSIATFPYFIVAIIPFGRLPNSPKKPKKNMRYMNYRKIIKLSSNKRSWEHRIVTCYNISTLPDENWKCPNPWVTELIKEINHLVAKKQKFYLTKEEFDNPDNWDS